MQAQSSNTSRSLKHSILNQKVLMLNGYSAIQSCIIDEHQEGSMFLEENTLLFIIEGAITIRYGEMEYKISGNQMAFLKRDILIDYETRCESSHSEKLNYILFSLKYELVKEFTKLAELPITAHHQGAPVCVNMPAKRLLQYIDSLEPYFIEPGVISESLVKIKLLELLFHLAGTGNNIILEQVLDLREQFRQNITATVEENIMNSVSLYQLAAISGRSLSSFRRDFLAIYNMPPSQWIRRKRLEKAQELLLRTTMTVTDICYTLGFESIAHFSRLFKSHFGNSPSEFRGNIMTA